jgi:hypothetical protein
MFVSDNCPTLVGTYVEARLKELVGDIFRGEVASMNQFHFGLLVISFECPDIIRLFQHSMNSIFF